MGKATPFGRKVHIHYFSTPYTQVQYHAVAAHAWSEKHLIKKEAKLLKQIEKPKELTVREKIYIQKSEKKKLMNFEIPSENDLVSRFFSQPMEGAKDSSSRRQNNSLRIPKIKFSYFEVCSEFRIVALYKNLFSQSVGIESVLNNSCSIIKHSWRLVLCRSEETLLLPSVGGPMNLWIRSKFAGNKRNSRYLFRSSHQKIHLMKEISDISDPGFLHVICDIVNAASRSQLTSNGLLSCRLTSVPS
ncbi:hypothetical protein L9F63_009918, partial [Diploptera punctata]